MDRSCVSVLENGTSTTTLSSTPTLRLMFLALRFTPSSMLEPSSTILPSSSWSDLLICRESELKFTRKRDKIIYHRLFSVSVLTSVLLVCLIHTPNSLDLAATPPAGARTPLAISASTRTSSRRSTFPSCLTTSAKASSSRLDWATTSNCTLALSALAAKKERTPAR